jgi:hypothetical protein
MKHKILIISVVIFVIGLLSIVSAQLYSFCNNPFNDEKFSITKWKGSSKRLRAKMAEDLIKNHLKPGLSRKQVIDLIGEDKNTDDGEVKYWLGSWSFTLNGYDDAFIFIKFDNNNKLVSAEINGY